MSSHQDDPRWQWAWSTDRRRAAIVTAEGYTVCPPQLTQQAAAGLVGEHNRLVAELAEFRKAGLL
jgi:hypothetical protein